MNTITTWNPARELEDIGESLFGFLGKRTPQGNWGFYTAREWEPTVDIEEDDKQYMLVADLPAVRREDIHVTLGDGTLELAGERKRPAAGPERASHRAERAYGKFGRTFRLPDNADPENMKAELREGTLTVRIPKTKETAVSRREIRVE